MNNSPFKVRAILLLTFVLGIAGAHPQALQIAGSGGTGTGGWDLTVSARHDSLGATGTVALVGGLIGEVLQIEPPSNNPSGCWCINVRRLDVNPSPEQRANVYIRDVGDGITSFDQFSVVSGAIDCSFPIGELRREPIRQGDFKVTQEGNSPPSATWMQPQDVAVLPAGSAVALTAKAADPDGAVSFVEFFADSRYIGRVAGSPTNTDYHFSWHPPRDGHFALHAVAVDNKGLRGFSGTARIFVGDGNLGVLDLGIVEVGRIGHTFLDPDQSLPPDLAPYMKIVWNYLIQQDQSSGGGAMLPSPSINWDTNSQFSITVSAPARRKFQVHVPPGIALGFGGSLWWESTRGDTSPLGAAKVTFEGFAGAGPQYIGTDAVLSESHGFFGFTGIDSTTVSNDFSFTSITLTGTVIPQRTGNGTEYYVPHLGSSLFLYYTTFETNDPGPFVSLVPLLTPAEQIEALIQQISTSSYPNKVKRPLINSLRVCQDAIVRGDMRTAIQLMRSFQHKVAARIGNVEPAYARKLTAAAQAFIDSLPSS